LWSRIQVLVTKHKLVQGIDVRFLALQIPVASEAALEPKALVSYFAIVFDLFPTDGALHATRSPEGSKTVQALHVVDASRDCEQQVNCGQSHIPFWRRYKV
jgi:hypothetical protein